MYVYILNACMHEYVYNSSVGGYDWGFVCAHSTYICISDTTVQRCIWMIYARGPRVHDVVLPFTLAGFSTTVRRRQHFGKHMNLFRWLGHHSNTQMECMWKGDKLKWRSAAKEKPEVSRYLPENTKTGKFNPRRTLFGLFFFNPCRNFGIYREQTNTVNNEEFELNGCPRTSCVHATKSPRNLHSALKPLP